MERVEVAKPFHGILAMIVCAVPDATDEEILAVCNRDNPAGTTNGWGDVVREEHDWVKTNPLNAPCACKDHEGRIHYIVLC